MQLLLIIVLVLAVGCYGDTYGEVDTVVTTQYGPVRGQAFPVYNGQFAETVLGFHGIPYAEPPVDDLRFAPPVEVTPWVTTRDAIDLPAVCQQDLVTGTIWFTHPGWTNMGEDCLTVDVYTPYDSSDGPYPVLVWFHGGSYQSGGAIQYPGQFLASHKVVVVVVQYRLGNFGFLYTGDNAVTPNIGLLDQQLSLQWVQNTIADFGGDPNHVTIAGESAGAGSVGLHMISPSSQGLFHQAIMESGGDMTEWAIINPRAEPELYSIQLAEDLNCPTADSSIMVSCLRSKTALQIQRFHVNCTDGYYCLGMEPVIDGAGGFIPDWPRALRETEQVAAVPVLSGINRLDGSFANIPFVINEPLNPDGLDRKNFTRDLRLMLHTLMGGLSDGDFEVMYREFDYVYAPWPTIDDQESNLDAMNELATDLRFGAAWDYQSKLHQMVAPVYNYMFDYRSEDAAFPGWTGTTHTMELGYVWGIPLLGINPNIQNDSQIGTVGVEYTVEDMKQTAYVEELWTNFVKFGNPTPEPVLNPNGVGSTTWSPFTWEEMNYLYIQRLPYVDVEWRQKAFALYEYLLPTTVGVYFDTSRVEDGTSPPSPGSASPGSWAARQLARLEKDYPEMLQRLKEIKDQS